MSLLVAYGCAGPDRPQPDLSHYVEVGTVTAHGVWSTKKILAGAGIPVYMDGSRYPLPYRILVPPEYRERTIEIMKKIEDDPLAVGYGIQFK